MPVGYAVDVWVAVVIDVLVTSIGAVTIIVVDVLLGEETNVCAATMALESTLIVPL